MAIEVEARFRVTDPGARGRLSMAPKLGAAELGAPATAEETDAYLDTVDGALAAARWACRLRRRGDTTIVSLKGPPEPGTGGWLHRRPEVEGPATPEPTPELWPASAARELLDRLRQGRALGVRLELHQRRTERRVTIEGAPVGMLSIDDVVVIAGGRVVGRFGIVELEATDDGAGGPARLAAIAAELAAVGGLVAEPRSKLERALELIADS